MGYVMRANSSVLVLRLVWQTSLATLPIRGRSAHSAVLTDTLRVGPRWGKWQTSGASLPSLDSPREVPDDHMCRPNRLQRRQLKSARGQACRQPWRALSLTIHVKVEAVELGITTPKNRILANIVLPDCGMMGQWLVLQVDEEHARRRMLPILGTNRASGHSERVCPSGPRDNLSAPTCKSCSRAIRTPRRAYLATIIYP